MKIVLNKCFGGFSLSLKARDLLIEKGFEPAIKSKEKYGNEFDFYYDSDCGLSVFDFRTHPLIIEVVEQLGPDANGNCSKLVIEEFFIEDFVDIYEFDGKESLRRKINI